MAVAVKPGALLIGLPEARLGEDELGWLRHPAVGGVVLFSRNYENRNQLQALCQRIHLVRDPPLVISVDQEGGRVQRFCDGFTRLPPQRVYGEYWQRDRTIAQDLAYRHGRVMAGELRACGVDLSWAPVLDLDGGSEVIGDRAFADDPEVVAALGRGVIAGMHDAGMAATGKHFPGHGCCGGDSHTHAVTDPRPLDDLRQRDMHPFAELAEALDAVMLAHVRYPAVSARPAGFSPEWIGDLLRGELAFGGLAVSDDLCMEGAADAGDIAARIEACLAAGCDLALVCKPDAVERTLTRLAAGQAIGDNAAGPLRGRRALSWQELDAVPEWRQWQASLAELSGQA